jgi:probable F420-dependent oxidoreductase
MLMQIGVVFPQTELGGDPDNAREFALAAERLGYRHLAAYDHVLGADHADREPALWGPYTEADPFHDPFVLFAYLAGICSLEFVTDVLVLPQRQTALVAKQATDLDLLSGGRLRLGVGTGWNYVEYEALGVPFEARGARLDEQIQLLRTLWSQTTVIFDGRFHRVTRASILPRPTRSIPIWIGGFSEPAFRRGARYGDGFLHAGDIDAALAGGERIRHHAAEAGRDLAGFGADFTANRKGTPATTAEQIERWREAGGTHFSVGTMRNGLDSLAAHVDFIADVAGRAGLTPA